MGRVTYPDPKVQSFIQEHFIPVQFNVVDHPELMEFFNSTWTPTIIVQDACGKEHRRNQGYLDPQRFLGELALAWLKDAIDRQDYTTAQQRVPEVLELTRGDPEREPEARYWAAVVDYKATHDPQKLVEGWTRLLEDCRDTEWAKKASFIRAA